REPVQGAVRRHRPVESGSAAADPRLHDLRAPSGLRDRVPDRASVPGYRHDRRDADHVDGDDDAAAFGHLAAGQDPVLRADRLLEPPDRKPGAFGKLINPAPAWRKAARLKWGHPPPRSPHEYSEHQRFGHAGQFELAVVDFPE